MGRLDRLKLLFEDDTSLLSSDTRLNPMLPAPAPVPEVDPGTATPVQFEKEVNSNQANSQPIPFGPDRPPAMANNSDEESDEYLSACIRTAKRREEEALQNALRNASLTAGSKAGKKARNGEQGRGYKGRSASEMFETPETPLSACFCPLLAVSRLPYKYIRTEASEPIAERFFNQGKFWNRCWDLYYIHPPPYMASRPLLLVPAVQVQQLINEINDAFQCKLSLPTDSHLGLVLPFHDDGTPQPKFLGQCTSRETKEKLEWTIPTPSGDMNDHNPPAGCSPEVDRSFAAFRKKIEAALDATKNKSKAARAKKRQDQIQRQKEWSRALKRTQCYLGLRPRRPRGLAPPEFNEDTTWEERQEAERAYGLACGTILLPFDVNKPAPFPFSGEPIFICVDVESNEHRHDQITEIGVSVLDTLDLVGVPPGEGGKNWISRIRSRHFRITERSYIVNKDYVAGCPDRFEFGQSEWVSIRDAAKVVDECFQPPYSAHVAFTVGGEEKDGSRKRATTEASIQETSKDMQTENAIPEYKLRPRNILFLGHDIRTDISYLQTLGSTVFGDTPEALYSSSAADKSSMAPQPNFLEALDTATLFRVLKRDTAPRSLAHVLLDLGITGWFLHNAGNDARYTMEAMIRIALKSRLLLDGVTQDEATQQSSWPLGTPPTKTKLEQENALSATHEKAWKAEIEQRVAEAVAESEAQVRDDCANWEQATGWELDDWADEDVDGGDGKGISLSNKEEENRIKQNKRMMRAAKNPGEQGRAWPEAK